MKRSNLIAIFVLALCWLALPSQASAQYPFIRGYASANYNSDTNIVSGSSSIELDYPSQEYYQGLAIGQLKDENGTLLASRSVLDTDRDGYASADVQAEGTAGITYTMNGHHRARISIQDPAWGYRYVDQYNYGFYDIRYTGEGQSYPVWALFEGRGPRQLRSLSDILLPKVVAETAEVLFSAAATCDISTPIGANRTGTLNIGSSSCAATACARGPGNAFNVTINFNLPKGADSLFPREDGRSFVADNETRQFSYIDWNFANVDYAAGRAQMVVRAFRTAREGATNDSLSVTVGGAFKNGGTFTGQAHVKLVCP